jgi:hypothetical protein
MMALLHAPDFIGVKRDGEENSAAGFGDRRPEMLGAQNTFILNNTTVKTRASLSAGVYNQIRSSFGAYTIGNSR